MNLRKLIIAIDGPVGSGKSTVARRVAQMLDYIYIDTGAMYRAIALKAIRGGVSLDASDDLVTLAGDTHIDLRAQDGTQQVLLDGEDVTEAIRSPEVSQAASKVATVAGRAARAGHRAAPRGPQGRRGDGRPRHRHGGFSGCGAENFSYRVAGNSGGAPLARASAKRRRDRPRAHSRGNSRTRQARPRARYLAAGAARPTRWWSTAPRWSLKKWRG